MQFTLTIELGSEAMQTYADVAVTLVRVSNAMRHSADLTPRVSDGGGNIADLNGATVGKWEVTETPARPEWGGYAETIITNPSDFDVLEVHGVRDLNAEGSSKGTQCEVDDENPEFFSVYAHLVEGGVECVGDFESMAEASAYGEQLGKQHGWPVHIYAKATPRVEFVKAGERGAEIPNWCVIDGEKAYPFGPDKRGKELAERQAAKWQPERFTYLGQ